GRDVVAGFASSFCTIMTSGAGASRDSTVVHGGWNPASGFMATITRCSRADVARRFASGFCTVMASCARASRDAIMVHGGGNPASGFVATIAR
ncbi:MAG: hypothetical protein Q7T79_01520, partial [bacterium]|nr:hypothetical protein [bacterium]